MSTLSLPISHAAFRIRYRASGEYRHDDRPLASPDNADNSASPGIVSELFGFTPPGAIIMHTVQDRFPRRPLATSGLLF